MVDRSVRGALRKSGSFNVKTSPRLASEEHQDNSNDLFSNDGRKTFKQQNKAYDMIKNAMGLV